jgi:hypothetical protein
MKYTTAAMAITQSEDIIRCAALRERPRPVLINASPAPASGTKKMNRIHNAVVVSEDRAAGLAGVIGSVRLWDSDGRGSQTPALEFPRRRQRKRKSFASHPDAAMPQRSKRFPSPPVIAENLKISCRTPRSARLQICARYPIRAVVKLFGFSRQSAKRSIREPAHPVDSCLCEDGAQLKNCGNGS